jgi:signal transduction histidine kinase
MLVAVIVILVSTFGTGLPDPVADLLLAMWPPAMVVAITIAVLQHHLYDVRVVIRRVAVYAGLAALLTAVFILVYFAVLTVVSEQVSVRQYRWASVVAATVVVVLIAEPVRRRLQGLLERRVLGDRSDPLSALARLQATFSASDEQVVLTTIVQTVANALRAPAVAIALYRDGGLQTMALVGREADQPLIVPLLYRGERLGELRVSGRTPGEPYGRTDHALIDQVAHDIAALVYGLRRDVELAGSRRQALQAVAEERSRLGRDLHDRLAPLLAGAGLTAEALRRGMVSGSPDEQQAGQLANRLRNAATEMRRVAYDLQPEMVGDQGLAAAVSDHISSLTGTGLPEWRIQVDLSSPLPVAVEQTAYAVLLEAINNVVRHAKATQTEVVIREETGELVIQVHDNGVGLAQPYISGLGITSMRSRVEALGGRFEVQPVPGGGTNVEAWIPLA